MATAFVLLGVLCLGLGPAAARAQGLDEMVFSVGTTTADPHERQWSYLLWQATHPDLISGRAYAVYAKTGEVASASLYTRKSVVSVQIEPLIIQTLLNRSIHLGENLAQLEEHIDSLFQAIVPTNTISLADKVSVVIRGALEDPEHYNNLILLSRVHPGMSLCLGFAYAELIPATGRMTYEIREFDPAADRDIAVVGRVTVEGGNPIVLPAPGPVVDVPDASAKGHLNVKLRWATSEPLRRLSLLNYGFNIYRMDQAYAEANGYHLAPPATAVLRSLAGTHPSVKRVNRPPVLQEIEFSAATVGNFDPATGDPETYFVVDDNNAFDPGGEPFVNGAEYYYFVTARDVLNRDGFVSAGRWVKVCDRLPPPAPQGLTVVNDYSFNGGDGVQKLKVIWPQTLEGTTQTNINYYVYRWNSPSQMIAFSALPLTNRIAGPIPYDPEKKTLEYVDDGPASPALPADAGRTFWYTVRVEDDGACGPNLSPNSAPAFGVLRDRAGPAPGHGRINLQCVRPLVRYLESNDVPVEGQARPGYKFRLICERKTDGLLWAEFYVFDPAESSNRIAKLYFRPGQNAVKLDHLLKPEDLQERYPVFFCRVAAENGKISTFALSPMNLVLPKADQIREIRFESEVVVERVMAGENRECAEHEPRFPRIGPIVPIILEADPTPGTKEYKFYRRVDGGPLTLICLGEVGDDLMEIISCLAGNIPANYSSLCFYLQFFDEHGNASAFSQLGCVNSVGTSELPVPLLSPVKSFGTETGPKMSLNWFCPPDGVDHFEVWIASHQEGLPDTISPMLSAKLAVTDEPVTIEGVTVMMDFHVYRTPRIKSGFGNGAQFSLLANVDLGKKYTVLIKAVSPGGQVGQGSNAEPFVWQPVALAGPQVPWPARGLPATNFNYHPNIQAVRLPNQVFQGIGIRIGAVDLRTEQGAYEKRERPYYVPGHISPMTYLYTHGGSGQTIFPVALYRYQVTNAFYPKVSGDVVQVSPLMENIAYGHGFDSQLGDVAVIYDPFILVLLTKPMQIPNSEIYLLDTQPVLLNARYRYLLVRFTALGEIEQVIVSNEVEVTP